MLHGFAFTMVVGIITGTYSSVFIAAAIVSFWRGNAPTRAAAHAPASPAPAAAQQPHAQAEAATEGPRIVSCPLCRSRTPWIGQGVAFCQFVDRAPADCSRTI